MKTFMLMTGMIALAVAGAGAASAADSPGQGPLALGAKAPLTDTKLKSATNGQDVTLAKVAGAQGTLVVFTCNGCPYAKAWEERIVTLGNTFAKKGVGVVLVNSNSPAVSDGDTFELMQARAKERGMTFPYAVDPGSTLARAFGAKKTPGSVPVRQDRRAGLPRHHRRQSRGAGQGQQDLPEGRAGRGGGREEAAAGRDQEPGLRNQIPEDLVARPTPMPGQLEQKRDGDWPSPFRFQTRRAVFTE